MSPDFPNFKRRNQLSKSNFELRFSELSKAEARCVAVTWTEGSFPVIPLRLFAELLLKTKKITIFLEPTCLFTNYNFPSAASHFRQQKILPSVKTASLGVALCVLFTIMLSQKFFSKKLWCLSNLSTCLLTDISYFAIKKSGLECAHAPFQGNARLPRTMWSHDRFDLPQLTSIKMSSWPGRSITRTFWILIGWFQVLTGKLKEDECVQACRDSQLCSNYNILNLEDPMMWEFNFPNYCSELFFKLLYWWQI